MNLQEFFKEYDNINKMLRHPKILHQVWVTEGKDPEQKMKDLKASKAALLEQLKNNQLSVNTVDDYNHLMLLACKNDYPEIVSALLENGKADPTANENEALYVAAQNGFTAVVWTLLLHNNEVSLNKDPKVFFQNALKAPDFFHPRGGVQDYLAVANLLLPSLQFQGTRLLTFFSGETNPKQFKEEMALYIYNPKLFLFSKYAQKNDLIAMKTLYEALSKEEKEAFALEIFREKKFTSRLNDYPIPFQNVETLKAVLTIPELAAKIAVNNNTLLRLAARGGHTEVVNFLVTIPSIREQAHLALSEAAHFGRQEVVKILLDIPSVRDFAPDSDNAILYTAAEGEHDGVVKQLVGVPSVQKKLLQSQCKQLYQFFNDFPSYRQDLINSLSIYAIPLSQVMKDIPEEKQEEVLHAFVENPVIYLEEKNYPPSTVEAVRISYAAQQVKDYKLLLIQRERDRERFNNVDDESRIGAVRGHFEQVIKPHFLQTFEKITLEGVEFQMRKMFLDTIKEEAQEKPHDEKAKALLVFIDSLSEEEKQKLFEGKDEALMAKVRQQFNDGASVAQTAWRAYDRWAPVGANWPNLLTPPLVDADKPVHTVRTVGIPEPTTQMASDLSRNMIAYSFLLVTDPQDGDDSVRATRKTAFIAKIAEIRRAHNESSRAMDDPSCLPGTISRSGDMWIAHSKSIIPDAPELLKEELQNIVLEKFKNTPKEELDKLFNGLIIFNINNLQDIIKGKVDITLEDIQQRKQFLSSLGSEADIRQIVNQRLEARGSRALSNEEFNVYMPAMLTDIGGPWISERLITLYRKDSLDTLDNPYEDMPQQVGIPAQSAMHMLRGKLQTIQIERKSHVILELAQLFSKGSYTQAYEKLRTFQVNDVLLEEIQKSVSSIQEEQAEAGKRTKVKAELWDKLYQFYQKTPIENKGDTLKEIVDTVVDERKALSEVLNEYKLPLPPERPSQRVAAISPLRDALKQARETKTSTTTEEVVSTPKHKH